MIRISAICLSLLVACTSAEPEVEFAATPLSPAEWESWSHAGVRSAHHEITVRRTMRTPDWCRHLDASSVLTGSDLVLRVSATEGEGPCPPGEGLWGYMAVVRNLRSGRYNLRVVHTDAAGGTRPEVVLRHQVLVE